MGRFQYNAAAKTDIEDRALAHIQIVMGSKLRRGESFYFTWRDDPSIGDGRRAVWIHPGADLEFKYYGSRAPSINAAWIDALAIAANRPAGLFVLSEPADVAAGHEHDLV
jgi:hypothetical protein